MTRARVLRDLLESGRDHDTSRLEEVAVELGLPLADVLVVAGRPVPGSLLPPERDGEVMREFGYRVTFCGHPQLAALGEFLSSMPDEGAAPESRPARDPADPKPFAAVLDGLLRNRGLGLRELPFVGLALPTIRRMLGGGGQSLPALQQVAGPLGWRLEDLAMLAGEPMRPLEHGPLLCRHVGAVFVAAVPRTTRQLALAAREADRLSAREDQGWWQPVSYGVDDCPDACP
ncbi:hypothetical protein GCM10009662_35160 [Catellatospora coxensis]|uniref:Uncharacterized protein n=2 Tax=Catellatospora coxensis TaxID=310354 RepID=A0A8J3L5H5_9ACTN|nr:hypothetical protein Cco03nite_62040 [Catellatospora coxensis]